MQSVPVPEALQDAFHQIGFEAMNARKRETFGLVSAGRDDEALIDYLVRFELRPDLAEWLVGLVRQYGAEFEFDAARDEAPPAVVPPAVVPSQVVAPPPPAVPAYQVPEYDRRASRATSIRASISALFIVAVLLVGGYVKGRNREIREINEDMMALEATTGNMAMVPAVQLKTEFGKDLQRTMIENHAISERFGEEIINVAFDDMFDPKHFTSLKGVENARAEVARSKAAIDRLTVDGNRLWNSFLEKHAGVIGKQKASIDRAIQDNLEAQRVCAGMLDSFAAYLDYLKANSPRFAPNGHFEEAKLKALINDVLRAREGLAEYLAKDDAPTSSAGDRGY